MSCDPEQRPTPAGVGKQADTMGSAPLHHLLDTERPPRGDRVVLAAIAQRGRTIRARRAQLAAGLGVALLLATLVGVSLSSSGPPSRGHVAADHPTSPAMSEQRTTGLPAGLSWAIFSASSAGMNIDSAQGLAGTFGAVEAFPSDLLTYAKISRLVTVASSNGVAIRVYRALLAPAAAVQAARLARPTYAATGSAAVPNSALRSCQITGAIVVEASDRDFAGSYSFLVTEADASLIRGVSLIGAVTLGVAERSPIEVLIVSTGASGAGVSVSSAGEHASTRVRSGVAVLALPVAPRAVGDQIAVTIQVGPKLTSLDMQAPVTGTVAESFADCSPTSKKPNS